MYKKLIQWSKNEHSVLPWRKKRTLYSTLVSEIMLQQTTVGTVLNHFEKFLKQYPNIKTLASSTEEELQIAWKGLGYYRRARNLRLAAIELHETYKGKFPNDKEKLMAIKGIGEYTSSALLAIGMDEPYLAIDANLERVLSRIYGIKIEKGPKLHKEIQKLFNENKIIQKRNGISFRDLNEALMDLGRTLCRANRVECDLCPIRKDCEAFKRQRPLEYPLQNSQKKQKFYELELIKFVVIKGKKVLSSERKKDTWLSGQIELPTFILHSEDKNLKQYPYIKKNVNLENSQVIKSTITKYKIKNYLLEITEAKFKQLLKTYPDYKFVGLDHPNFTTTSLKSLKKLSKL